MAHGAVVLIAAVGSIATSPPRWHVAATPAAKASSGKGQLVTIEASAGPTVMAGNGSIGRLLRPEGQAGAWTGRADYFVPPSEALTSVGITGTCSGGGSCAKCEPPPTAFVRIVSTVEVEPWVLDASSTPANIDLTAPESRPSFRVVVAATRPPALAVKLAAPMAAGFYVSEMPGNPYVDPKDDPQAATKRYAFSVSWYRDTQAAGPWVGAWTPSVTISGYCKEPGPCVVPASESVTILSIEGPPGSGAASTSPPRGAAPAGSAGP
ncbi:hypothetical protein [Polyangium sp. 6x1]|uniref:hypothetical protein n=1 Tax=Polyangium sp. 6x1 TaxID=3042689 RepID=UPI00248232ED|nr:hypothetical protein [Polyangium sp. 6x1]MDI1446275.1 hypothetical protein [Polyangium sp. 6x1]